MRGKEKKIFCIEATVLLIALTTVPIVCSGEDPLPYWLEGTILDGNTRVLIIMNGNMTEGIDPNEYDVIISFDEALAIESDARAEYIEIYGVDPLANINPVTYNEVTWPTGNIAQEQNASPPEQEPDYIPSSYPSPHTINGKLILFVTLPINKWKPSSPIYCGMMSVLGFDAFHEYNCVYELSTFIDMSHWDADDVGFGWDLGGLLDDLAEDMRNWVNEPSEQNRIYVGWVSIENARWGLANLGDHFSVVNALAMYEIPPLGTIVTHEISHNFHADDHDWWWPLPMCVMHYLWVALHYKGWCSDCHNVIQSCIVGT